MTQRIRLGELATVSAGQGAPQGAESYSIEGTPFVKAGDLSDLLNGKSEASIQKVTQSTVERYKLKLYPKGTVLFAKSGMSCMKGYVYTLKSDCYVVSHLACIIPHEIESEYLKYYFEFYQPNQLVKDTSYPSISLTDIAEMPITVFNKTKRYEIVYILDVISTIIARLKRELVLMDQLVKSRFIEMFGDPVSNIYHWTQLALKECLNSIDNGKSFMCSSEVRVGDNPAVLKLSAVTSGIYKSEENKAILDEKLFVDMAEVYAGDLLFTRKNTPELVGMSAYVYETPRRLMMPDLIFRLNTNDKCNKIYLWQLINHDLFRNCIRTISNGSAKSMSNISKERLGELEIIVPPIVLQDRFAAFVTQLDKSKSAVQKTLDKLQLLRKALMQKYFG